MTRSLAASIAAHASWAHTPDRAARTLNARIAMMDRFYTEVDPEGVLPVHERELRAGNAKKAYFRRLALKSAKARAK